MGFIIGDDNLNTFQVVIRRLPPSFTEEQLKEELGDLPEHDFFYFVGSDIRYTHLCFCFRCSICLKSTVLGFK